MGCKVKRLNDSAVVRTKSLRCRFWRHTLFSVYSVCSVVLFSVPFCLPVRAQDADEKKPFFLPKSPIAAAYVLGRLSNKELIEAPRSEFVYVALLQRKGLEKKYRSEALNGLAKARNTDPVTELIGALAELDKKGEESEGIVRELSPILFQFKPPELAARKEALSGLASDAQLPLTRQIALGGGVVADGSPDGAWTKGESNPQTLTDLILGIPLIPDASLRGAFYSKVEPLLRKADPPEVRRAAMTSIGSIPGHDVESFKTLAAFAGEGTERESAVTGLQRIPKKSWPKELAEPLANKLIAYMGTVPGEKRTESDFVKAMQFVSELASLLPSDKSRALNKTLRGIGARIVVIHTIYEQMLYDKLQFAVEAGKPVQIILENPDAMQHNLLLLAPGSAEEIGNAAEKMSADTDAQGRAYVPDSPKVLQATRLLNSGETAKLNFNAPTEIGDYPYFCSFPGHWRRMLGNMKVVKDLDEYEATTSEPAQPVLTEWKVEDLAPELNKVGMGRNLVAGKELFTKLSCIQCHKAGKEGNVYGPDLTEVFKRWKGDRASVLREILEPSKVIADRYRNYQLDLADGDQIFAMIVKEDADTVTIQTGASDALIKTMKKSDIKAREPQKSSLMPLGLLATLNKDQIFDLLAFLEAGGNTMPPEHQH